MSALLIPVGAAPGELGPLVLGIVHPWLSGALVGAAIAWGGLGTRARVVAAGTALGLLWVVPATFTAVSSAVGSRVLLPYPAEMVEYGLGVFRVAASAPELVLPPILLAVVVAAAGVVWQRRHVTERRPGSTLPV